MPLTRDRSASIIIYCIIQDKNANSLDKNDTKVLTDQLDESVGNALPDSYLSKMLAFDSSALL